MNVSYKEFDVHHSMIGLLKNRINNNIILKGQSNDSEMKIMLISSKSGMSITLSSVFSQLCECVFSDEGEVKVDTWVDICKDVKCYFHSIQNVKCQVKGQLCRYTAFSYIIRNDEVIVYDCDNGHKAFVDITMPIFYSIKKETVIKKRAFRKAEEVDTGYYRVSLECEDASLYKTGYIEYLCGEKLIPITEEMIKKDFFIKNTGKEPELTTHYKELVDLKRR